MIDSMEKGYKVNGHVVQFLDVMCGDAWKKKGYHGPVICNYADGADTRESGRMVKDMGPGHISLLLEQNMKESGKTMKQVVMEFVIMQTE